MPRVVDRRPRRVADKDPLAGLLGYDLTEAAEYAGQGIRDFMLQIRDTWAQWLRDATGIDLTAANEFFDYLVSEFLSRSQLDLSSPQKFVESLGDLLRTGAEELFNNSVIAISRIGNIIQDLINGAGEFLTADSVKTNPFWSWDSVMPGFISGGSIRATANGTQQVMRSEPFRVFPGQTLELRAASQWTGASATAGSNPVKVGFTPFDADGNPLADVIRGSLQPSGDHGWQWIPVADKWPVPAGVKYVSQLLILDAGATAGTFRFSNASAWASNLLDLGLVKDLREMVDAIGGVVNSEAANIEDRLQAITADGKITASEIVGLIQQAQVSGLAIMQTVINQILDILNGNIVTPINSLVQGVKDWFGLNQNKTQKLTSGGNLTTADVTGTFDMSRVDDLVDNLGNILSGVKDGADGVGTGTTGAIGDRINQAKDSLLALLGLSQDALKSAIAAQTTLQEQETEQNTGDGNSYSFVFSGADGAALNSTDWTTGPTPGDITIRGDSGYAGVKNGNPDGYYFASPNYTYATDGQSASFVLGNTQNGNYYSGVFIRCNADRTTGAYCLAKEGEVRVGKFTRSGTSWTFATPMTFQGGLSSVKQGARIEIRCSGDNFFVRVNGKPVTSATDVAGTIAAGPDYRYAMFCVQRATSWFTYDSYRIAAFAMSDYVASGGSATLSNAWSLTRSSTSGFTYTDPITSAGQLPASFFTFTDYANGATITDLGRGAVTVDQAGLYKLATTCRPYSAKGPVTPHWCLYRNDVQVTGAIGPGAEFEILLNAGDKIQPALIVVDYDVRSNGSTGSETVVSRTITQVFGVASFTGRKLI
ncbi:Bacteriophage protein [Mycobacteroides abscessus subsp. abscessus]|nr:Bacteriophage protein [Mycobacteroides abscessus subsp. abscessus]SHY41563.1 Bacteriophage protein [Mycobacteroides abscessus subsp. abscessus]SIC62567.1 Bacteriophage protein [Mycobacteroides abscessus subsp. abscessus]SKW34180.1 Bacteriophage protein [Mycobacteroides abscessus subsp. abscessus]